MVTQKAISVKIDKQLYDRLELEKFVTNINRNRLINAAILHYLKYSDARRRAAIYGKQEEFLKAHEYLNAKL